MLQLFSGISRLAQGRSYWQVKLSTGKTVTEGQLAFDFTRGTRNIIWLQDIVGSGDNHRIQELTLCTPEGDVSLAISAPCSAFQLQMGLVAFFGNERIPNAQIIGRLDNRETGECTACIWDVQGEEQPDGTRKHLFTNHKTNVRSFTSWRGGIPHLGALNYGPVGLGDFQ